MSEKLKLVKKYYLYLDASEPKAVIGLVAADEEFPTFHLRNWEAGRELSATLSGKISTMLSDNSATLEEISGIVVFIGPGSFTGLRIGVSFVNGLAFALNIPVYETKVKEAFDLKNPKEIALPFYGADPKITKPKKK